MCDANRTAYRITAVSANSRAERGSARIRLVYVGNQPFGLVKLRVVSIRYVRNLPTPRFNPPILALLLLSRSYRKHAATPGIPQNLIESRKVYRDITPSRLEETEPAANLGITKTLGWMI